MPENVAVSDLNNADVLTFNNYGTAIVPDVTGGTLLGTISGGALRDPATAATHHANIFSALPVSPLEPLEDNYTKYDYLTIRLTDESIVEIGIPWLIPASLTRLLRKTALVVIPDFDEGRLSILNELLSVNGFNNVVITVS